jgi:hypothetical protein
MFMFVIVIQVVEKKLKVKEEETASPCNPRAN